MKIVPYDRNKGVAYAHKWAFSRNPVYSDFLGIGGDCTNFISQCIYAGSGVMNFKPVFGWFYKSMNNRTPSWTGVEYLYNFLTGNKEAGPFGNEASLSDVMIGDIVQLSFDNTTFGHSLYVVSVGNVPALDNVLIATHTFNSDNRPLSTYNYERYRVIHINGVRKP